MAAPSPLLPQLNHRSTTSLHFSNGFSVYFVKRHLKFISCCFNKVSKNVKNVVVVREEKKIKDSFFDNDLDNEPLKKLNRFGIGLDWDSVSGKNDIWWRKFFGSSKVRSVVLLNVITIIYASNIPVVKEVEAFIDPEAFTVVRFAVAAIPFIPFVFKARNDAKTRNAGLELGFWVSLGYILQALGLLTSDAGRASFITMFTVIVVPLIDGMLGSKIPARTWFGAFVSVVGVAMLESSGSPPCIGDLLNFLSAVSFGIHMLRTEKISRVTKGENYLPLLGYQICTVAFLSTTWYCIEGYFGGGIQDLNPFSWTWTMTSGFPWIPALYTGILSTSLCLWVEMTSMRNVSATDTAIIYGLEPVWGAGFAWFLLGERWGVRGWIGAALVLAGSLTVQIMGAKSDSLPKESMKADTERNGLLISDEQNHFSVSPIVLKTRKVASNILKK